ncbi:BMP-binding endothelial regulator protein isoform X1 [Dermacentor andersoni]|uniref:BMP-binding endothelial regulator protein isoform X1 n=1 Tax=Dermacentor andersoni TaxID=34620 RepID=UPI002155789E|nr:BMP-binding endothelial regulator protein-like isoform X1 [Dermacentor andersoni]
MRPALLLPLLLATTAALVAGFSNPNLRGHSPSCALILASWLSLTVSTLLKPGDSIKCGNEGQITYVPGISTKCITCKCQNSVVQCGRETCPLPRGCYFLQESKGNKCCDVCKGCVYKGRVYASSEEWTDPQDPCRRFFCQSGVITESRIYCHVNCKNPRNPPEGQCCPYCEGCVVNGRQYAEGDTVPSDERDPCVVCRCKDGRVTCTKKSCPVLPCPPSRIAQTPGTCCPECRSGKRLADLNGQCSMRGDVYDNEATWPYDQCTNCQCQNGTIICQRTVCPPLQCPPEHQEASPDSCCSQCRRPEEKKAMCFYNNQKRYNGETWKLKKCTTCSCHHGVVRCGVEECISAPVCPPKKKLVTPPGKCCPTCVEEDGICTVYGDPHYRTFDGRMFNYQGPCRYVLASDCVGGTFSIEVWNDVRYSKSFSWTKSVVIKIKDVKVKLGQFMRVRIQKERVKLPYVMLQVLNINQEDHNIVVRINKGVKVVWDGDNYVEVSVPPNYKNKLCGLCGNYNDRQDDDFMSRNGTRLTEADAFGNSWLVGRRKKCFRQSKRASHPLDCRLKDWNLRQQNLRLCNHIKQEPFKACHKVVEATPYFRSCMLDMCECLPSDKCYCDSLNAYARECSRAGIKIDWKNTTNCEGMHCPRGSDYTPCGPPCRRTCKNHHLERPCRRKCQPGCQCNPGLVWHRDRCVPPSECPVAS